MLFTQLKQFEKQIVALSLLLVALAGQNVCAASHSAQTDLIQHNSGSGGEGKDVVTLKKPEEVAARACVAFVGASLVPVKFRFGKANIVQKPAKGCDPVKKACKLVVAWNHAPAGLVSYRLNVQWDVQNSGC